MVKTTLFKLYIIVSIVYFAYSPSNVLAQSQSNFTTVPIGQISNLPLHLDYEDFPLGEVSFLNVPFSIPVEGNNFLATHNVACVSCPKEAVISDLSINNPKTIWVLANASDAFTRFDGQNYGFIKVDFIDGSFFTYDFIVGLNVREWLQSGNYGSTVNTTSSDLNREAWRGYRPSPNYEYPVITDLLQIDVPPEHFGKTITSITFVDDSLNRVNVWNPQDPGLIIKGLTVESDNLGVALKISAISNWPGVPGQVPVDREAEIEVLVEQGGVGVEGVEVSGEVLEGFGELDVTTVATDEEGVARFVVTPNGRGVLRLSFEAGEQSTEFELNVYRSPIVIVPGHGASFNGKEMLLGEVSENWHWFTQIALNGWDAVIAMLEQNGYMKGYDYTIAFYDWRKSLSGDDPAAVERFVEPAIDELLEDRPEGQKVTLLAHSFGGLVSRALLTDEEKAQKVQRLVTFGTPHRGSANAYYAWEGGKAAPTGDAFFRSSVFVASRLMRKLGGYNNNVQAIWANIPSVRNLLPIFSPYLMRNSNSQLVETSSLLIGQNDLLEDSLKISNFLETLEDLSIAYDNVVGGSQQSIGTIRIGQPSGQIEWMDGKPIKAYSSVLGDNTVEAAQALLGDAFDSYALAAHGDLPDGSRALLRERLKLSAYEPSDKKKPKQMLSVLILSPAYAEILDMDGQKVSEEFDLGDGEHKLVYLTDPQDEAYQIRVVGTGTGEYELFANLADETLYDELELKRSIQNGEVHTHLVVLDGEEKGLVELVDTSVNWTLGAINLRRNVMYSTLRIPIPKGLPVDQLEFDSLKLNDTTIPIAAHRVLGKGSRMEVEVETMKALRALRYESGRLRMTVTIMGEEKGVRATGNVIVPGNLRQLFAL